MERLTTICSIVLMAAVTAFAQPVPTWYWDGETDVANISTSADGDSIEYGGSAAGIRTTDEAYAGEYGVQFNLPWAKAGAGNHDLSDAWCPVTEGTLEMMWKNIGPADGAPMLFMLHTKWKSDPAYDTNDGFALYQTGATEFRLYYNRSGLGSVAYKVRNVPVVNGQWYRIRVRYKVGVGMSFQLDDNEQRMFESDLQPIVAPHWYNLMWGNDTHSTCNYYLDEMKVYDHWIADGDSMVPSPVSVATGMLPAAVESTAYSASLAAIGGTAPYTWDASGLPAGLSLNGNAIEGTPADTGVFDVTLTVTDADDSTASRTVTLDVRPLHVQLPGGADRMEAEDMVLDRYSVDGNGDASGGQCIRVSDSGSAQYAFAGMTGTYDLDIAYFDENDGSSEFAVYINDTQVDAWTADQDLGSGSPVTRTLVVRTLGDIALAPGDIIRITGTGDGGEYGRLDYVETVPAGTTSVIDAVQGDRRRNASITGGLLFDHTGRAVNPAQARPGIYMRYESGSLTPVKVLVTE